MKRLRSRRTLVRAAALLALPLALVCLELGLRAFVAVRESLRSAPRADGVPEIWCIGDSHTEGVGAPPGRGYPEQLQERLRRGGKPYRVVNLGRAGSNSTQTVARLKERLGSGARPALVIALTGVNDNWNLSEVDRSLLGDAGPAERLRQLSQRSRLVQLARSGLLRLRAVVRPARPDLYALLSESRWAELKTAAGDESAWNPDARMFDAIASLELGDFAASRRSLGAFLLRDRRPALPIAPSLALAETARLEAIVSGEAPPPAYYAPPSGHPASLYERLVMLHGRGWRAASLGRDAEARRDFQALESLPGINPLAAALGHEGAGWLLLRRGRSRQALSEFERVLRDQPAPSPQGTFFWTRLGKAVALGRLGALAGARRAAADARRFAGAVAARDCWCTLAESALEPSPPLKSSAEARALKACPWLRSPAAVPPTSYLEERPHLLVPIPPKALREASLTASLRELSRLARSRGFPLIVMTYPQPRHRAVSDVIRRAVGADAARLDLEELMGGTTGWISADGFHPNEAGYGTIAAALEPLVR